MSLHKSGCRSSGSAEVVLASLLLKQVELLEGLQSVHSQNQVVVGSESELLHVVLELHVVEDHSSDVVGVLLGQGFIWA